MQQKPKVSVAKAAVLLVVIILVGGTAALMMSHVPAPQHPIEKQLDAKAFLGQKQ